MSLNGTHGVIDCRLDPAGEDWSVGHLITIAHRNARLVGVVCEVATIDARWSEREANLARVTFELSGEIIDRAPDPSVFYRGVRSYPSLGATVHQMRADDLRTIYTFRGKRGVDIGRLSQNSSIPAEISVDQMIARHFAVLGATGVGKTTAASMLISSAIAARPNLRVLVLDPHTSTRRISPASRMSSIRTAWSFRSGFFVSTNSQTSSSAAARLIRTNATRSMMSSRRQRPTIAPAPPPRACCAAGCPPKARR